MTTQTSTPDLGSGHVDVSIGEAVHLLMFRRNLRQTEVALLMGLTQSALSRKLRGYTQWTLNDVFSAAHALRVPAVELMPAEWDWALFGGPRPDMAKGPTDDGEAPRASVRQQGLEPRTRWFSGRHLELVAS